MSGYAGRIGEQYALVNATSMVALTGSAGNAAWVSLKSFYRVTAIIQVLNATTVTGGVVTLKQATDITGTGEKALTFTKMQADIDVAASQTLTETVVTSSTFTTDTTNSKRLCYVIEVDASSLDRAHDFDYFRVDVDNMASAVGMVTYLLWNWRRYSDATILGL